VSEPAARPASTSRRAAARAAVRRVKDADVRRWLLALLERGEFVEVIAGDRGQSNNKAATMRR
jgi:hypothetical protein